MQVVHLYKSVREEYGERVEGMREGEVFGGRGDREGVGCHGGWGVLGAEGGDEDFVCMFSYTP